jgi:hypothetical protein
MSTFKVAGWIPKYLRWYGFAFGPPLTVDELRNQRQQHATSNE